jgi:hypothetical protein
MEDLDRQGSGSKKRPGDELASKDKRPKDMDTGEICRKLRNLEARTNKIEKDLLGMKADTADGKRQYTKRNLILSGDGLPPRPKKQGQEDCASLYAKICLEKYGVKVDLSEIGDVHRIREGIIAEFNNRKVGSPYDRLIHRFGNWNPNPSLAITINIATTRYDSRIKYIATRLKHAGIVQQFHTDKSGKIRIRGKTGESWNTINDVRDIEKLIPKALKEVMDQEDRAKATDRNKKGGPRAGQKGPVTGANASNIGDSSKGLSEEEI